MSIVWLYKGSKRLMLEYSYVCYASLLLQCSPCPKVYLHIRPNTVNICPNAVNIYSNTVNICPITVNICSNTVNIYPNTVNICPNAVNICSNTINICLDTVYILPDAYLYISLQLQLVFVQKRGFQANTQSSPKILFSHLTMRRGNGLV